jgi:hypothetical protein
MYRQFVYERALLRELIPYSDRAMNFEFQYYVTQRMNDGFVKEYNEDQFYEEFIRNKALDNTLNVNSLFKTNKVLGIYSVADRFMRLMIENPQLLGSSEYEVLNTLSIKNEGGYSFLTQKFKEKDPDQLTAYVIQMMNLMDPAEVIATREGEKQAIANFFSMLPLVAFMQSGNNTNSRISMGAIFDQTRTGLPEMLLPSLNSFINDLNSSKSSEILNKYTELFNQKQPSVDEKRYIPGAVFVNYSSSMANQIEVLTPSTVIGHSGGAAGADTKWDQIGQEFGPIKFKHYYTGERSEKNAPLGNVDITDKPIAVEGASKVAKAANKMWGNQKDGKIVPYAYATMKDERLIRNWAQVANSDAVFAIAPIGKAGDVWSEDVNKEKEKQRIVIKSEIVQGGTGYAVEMAIQAGKPVYVYNDPNVKAQSHLPKGWYTWDGSQFVAIDTPSLTRNFAAIGSRNMSAEAEQAIRDVYKKTFGESAQASTTRKTYSGKVVYNQIRYLYLVLMKEVLKEVNLHTDQVLQN